MSKEKVIGTGGIGLCVLPVLGRFLNYEQAKFPTAELHLIDGDRFESKNAARQEFSELGPKATVTANKLRQQFGRIQIYDHPVYLSDDNIVRHIRENDIIMCCVDNHKTRKIVHDRVCELNNVTFISGGNDDTDGNVFCHIRRDGKNVTCPITKFHDEINDPTDLHPSELNQPGSCSRQAESTPQIVIVNNLIASGMLCAFYNVTDAKIYAEKILKNPALYGEVSYDMLTLKASPLNRPA